MFSAVIMASINVLQLVNIQNQQGRSARYIVTAGK